MSVRSAQPLESPPHCAAHPDRPALAACQRCGTFVCSEEHRLLEGIVHCRDCASRPEADPLEAYRLRHWGKPDVWGWVMGLSALPQLWVVYFAFSQQHGPLWVAVQALMLGVDVGYFLGQRWARLALLTTPVLLLLPAPESQARLAGAGVEGLEWMDLAMRLTLAVFTIGILAVMWFDVRNQLFFRLDVSRERLQRAYASYADNRIAIWGMAMAVTGFLVPGLSVAAFPMLVTAWVRSTQPALKNRRRGLIGGAFAVATLTTLFWGALLAGLVWFGQKIQSGEFKP